MDSSDKRTLGIFIGIIGLIILIIACYNLFIFMQNGEFKGEIYKGANPSDINGRNLNWEVKETISYTYEGCKDINRHKPIKRWFMNDYMLPMCPKAYVVLYDEYQKIVFMFNRENEIYENPTILTVSTSCDNSTGEC